MTNYEYIILYINHYDYKLYIFLEYIIEITPSKILEFLLQIHDKFAISDVRNTKVLPPSNKITNTLSLKSVNFRELFDLCNLYSVV